MSTEGSAEELCKKLAPDGHLATIRTPEQRTKVAELIEWSIEWSGKDPYEKRVALIGLYYSELEEGSDLPRDGLR